MSNTSRVKPRIAAALLLVGLGSSAGATQISYVRESLTVAQRTQMRQALEAIRSGQKLPGLVAAATRGDRVIWVEGVGHANIEAGIAVDPFRHLFRWASVSKVATERFAQDMHEMGLLNRAVPIEHYLGIKEPTVRRRCFSADANLQKFSSCAATYGGTGPILPKPGSPSCFLVSSVEVEPVSPGSDEHFVQARDTTYNRGVIQFTDDEGTVKCSAPYAIDAEPVTHTSRITLNRLLSHGSGIQHYGYLGLTSEPPLAALSDVAAIKGRRQRDESQMEWAIGSFYPKHPLVLLPGTGTHYSTFGYNLAGVVLERRAGKTFESILSSHAWALGALSMQADALGLAPSGPYVRSTPYRRAVFMPNGFMRNDYTTDNSYKVAGGGIMSTIVDMARFCVGIGNTGMVTAGKASSYTHSGSHASRSKAYLRLRTGGQSLPQCIVLMTNTEHGDVDLVEGADALTQLLYGQRHWTPPRAD